MLDKILGWLGTQWLRHMRPTRAANDVADCAVIDAEHRAQFSVSEVASRVKSSDLCNLLIRQLGGPCLLSSWWIRVVSILLDRVENVLSICAALQVRWITTGRVVAGVHNAHSFGDSSVAQFVRNAMRKQGLAPVRSFAVSGCGSRPLPFPALIIAALIYALPKAFQEWASGCMSPNKTHGTSPDMPDFHVVFLCDWSGLSAPALAHLSRNERNDLARCVAFAVSNWLTFDPSFLRVAPTGDSGLLSTSALAKAVRDLIRGIA